MTSPRPTGPSSSNLSPTPPPGELTISSFSNQQNRWKTIGTFHTRRLSSWISLVFLSPVSRDLPLEEEVIQTQLHNRTSDEYYTYSNVPWKLFMRKEASIKSVFISPQEINERSRFKQSLCTFLTHFVLFVYRFSTQERLWTILCFLTWPLDRLVKKKKICKKPNTVLKSGIFIPRIYFSFHWMIRWGEVLLHHSRYYYYYYY